jgi:hypothetical protein
VPNDINPSDSLNLWDLLRKDVDTGKKQVKMVNGRTEVSAELSQVWVSLNHSNKPVLNKNDVFAALLDVPSTAEGMRKIGMRVPTKYGTYTSCDYNGYSMVDTLSLGTAATPTGWFSPPHYDYEGAVSGILHLLGRKIWVTFPRTDHNTSIMEPSLNHFLGDEDIDLVAVLDQLEQVSCRVFHEPEGFFLSPFEYHACLCLTPTIHIGGPAWFPRDVKMICKSINTILDDHKQALKKSKKSRSAMKDKMNSTITAMMTTVELGERSRKYTDMVRELAERLDQL